MRTINPFCFLPFHPMNIRRSLPIVAFSMLTLLAGHELFMSIPVVNAVTSVPQCKGKTATVYVSGTTIVGGPDDGETYAGQLRGGFEDDVIVGTEQADTIMSESGNDTVCGLGGADDIDGGNGDDVLCGGGGNDIIDGGNGNDQLCGEDGDDDLKGKNGDDILDGGSGTDIVDGGLNNDVCGNSESTDNCEQTGTSSTCDGSVASSSVASSHSSVASSVSSSAASSATSVSSSASSVSSSSSSFSFSFGFSLPGGGSTSSFSFSIPGFGSSSSSVSSTSSHSSVSSQSSSSSVSSVSSSSSSVASQSSSSSSSQQSQPILQSFTAPITGLGGYGAYRGERSNELLGVVNYVGKNLGFGSDIAPSAVGGSPRAPLTSAETQYLCSMQRAMPASASTALMDFISDSIASLMGRRTSFVKAQLSDAVLCKEISASRLPQNFVATADRIVISVDENGFPVSSNATWNACFNAAYGDHVLTLQDIRSNTDVDKKGTPRDCAYYNHNSLNIWYMPDVNDYFSFDPDTSTATFSSEYMLVPQEKVAVK